MELLNVSMQDTVDGVQPKHLVSLWRKPHSIPQSTLAVRSVEVKEGKVSTAITTGTAMPVRKSPEQYRPNRPVPATPR